MICPLSKTLQSYRGLMAKVTCLAQHPNAKVWLRMWKWRHLFHCGLSFDDSTNSHSSTFDCLRVGSMIFLNLATLKNMSTEICLRIPSRTEMNAITKCWPRSRTPCFNIVDLTALFLLHACSKAYFTAVLLLPCTRR